MGFQERDPAALARDDERLGRWLRRGASHHVAGRPGLVDLAVEGLRNASVTGRGHWTTRLAHVDAEEVSNVLAAVPTVRLSAGPRSLTRRILEENRRRLRDALG
jgi:hypothetical protein